MIWIWPIAMDFYPSKRWPEKINAQPTVHSPTRRKKPGLFSIIYSRIVGSYNDFVNLTKIWLLRYINDTKIDTPHYWDDSRIIICSVPNSSNRAHIWEKTGTFSTKIRALDRHKDGKNPSFCIKKARKFNSWHFNDKCAYINTIFKWKFIWGKFLFNKSLDCFKMAQSRCYMVYLA